MKPISDLTTSEFRELWDREIAREFGKQFEAALDKAILDLLVEPNDMRPYDKHVMNRKLRV